MKKVLLLFVVLTILIPLKSFFPQTLSDYISEVREDTLVVKDYSEMNDQPNSLYWVLSLDTANVPAGRVYELRANGYYPNYYTTNSSANHTTVIVGEDTTRLVNNKNANSSPPLICIQVALVDPYPYGIIAGGNLTIKNCELSTADIAGSTGWLFSITSDSNLNLLFENCLFEHTQWAFVVLDNPNCNVTFRDCYFVNMNGYPCGRDGGVLDCFADQDSLLVENCTHIMA